MDNIEKTIISQYGNKYTETPILMALIENFNDCIDPKADIANILSWIADVDTAQGFGLDIIGRIVGVKRSLLLPAAKKFLGFSQYWYPFGYGVFYNSKNSYDTQDLDDTTYRKLIQVKMLYNLTTCDVLSLNKLFKLLLEKLGETGKGWIKDTNKMQIVYKMDFVLSPTSRAIFNQLNLLPSPAGVQVFFREKSQRYWGFSPYGSTFNHGSFYRE